MSSVDRDATLTHGGKGLASIASEHSEEKQMKLSILLVPALLSFGCSSEPGRSPAAQTPTAEPTLGQLDMELLGSDSAGNPYRLRNATFQIYGNYFFVPVEGDAGDLSHTVSSDTDPDATTISTRLLPGAYTVTLDNGWFLEKVTATGAERVDQSILLSPSSQYTYVYDRQTTDVIYTFGVDGTLIDFRLGSLNIGFNVEHPNEDGGVQADGG
jgi:hypothetical protein